MVVREPITVVVSEKGWIRALRGHVSDLSGVTFKTDDALKFAFPTETTAKILIFAGNGKFYTLEASKLPGGRGHGEPVRLYFDIEQDADVVAALAYQGGRKFLVASYGGNGFVVPEDEVLGTTRKGKQVLNLKAPDKAAALTTVDGELAAAIGENRKMVIFPLDQVPEMTRGRGVRLQRYKEKGLSDVDDLQGRRRAHLDRHRRPQLHADAEGAGQLARQPRRRRPHRPDSASSPTTSSARDRGRPARSNGDDSRIVEADRLNSPRTAASVSISPATPRRCRRRTACRPGGGRRPSRSDCSCAAWLRLQDGLVGAVVGQHRGADAHVVAVGDARRCPSGLLPRGRGCARHRRPRACRRARRRRAR